VFVLCATVLWATGDAYAVRRILLVGDSWAQFPWKLGSYQAVLNYNYGTGTYEVEGTYTAIGGSTVNQWANNAIPPESSFPSPPGYTNMPLLDRINWSLANWPTIDIIHVSITGNDMWAWRADWTPAQTQALYDSVQNDLQTFLNWLRTNHPTKKILLCGYDYTNFTETCTYGMQEFDWNNVAMATLLGFTVGDIWQNKANNQAVNQLFVGFGDRMKNVALATPRVDFLNNFGIVQYVKGYRNSLGWVFLPGSVPFPGYYPSYTPLGGGDITYGTGSYFMYKPNANDNRRDAIHLSDEGYKVLFDNAVMQYYNGWLTDSTAPTVTSITRLDPSPTEANEVRYSVTFSENVVGVDATDFQLTGTSAGGASIIAVEGSDATASRTVRIDISSAPNGTLGLNLVDDGSIYDLAWNQLGGEGSGNGNFSTGPAQTYVIDRVYPEPTVTPAEPEPTNETSMNFTVSWNKPVTGFTASDIVLTIVSGQGTAEITNFAGSDANYSFTLLVNRTQTIKVAISIPAAAAQDSLGRNSLAGAYQDGDDNAYTFNYPYVNIPDEDIYLSDGSLGDLVVNSGSISINTGLTPPTLQVGANPPIYGTVIPITGGLVAKFNFRSVTVNTGVSVSVTGNRPLVLAASRDMQWNTTLDVSGNVAGRAGGGIGGNGGAPGTGGLGAPTNAAGGGGGPAACGGAGGDYSNSGCGQSGCGRNSGSAGANGSAGNTGASGTAGSPGTPGFGLAGSAGSGGAQGSAGTPQTTGNGGSAGIASGGEGGGGGCACIGCNGAPGGNAWAGGVDGGNGGIGANGGAGGAGSPGTDADFTAPANTLGLAAGHGGGGGGGGGGGAGGQGGGKGGGGSSGAGGGGGAGSWNTVVGGACAPNADGFGGAGGYGGAGGGGGNGGGGGTGGNGGGGGNGGNGGGVVVLAARGILRLGGTVNISSSAPTSGAAGSAGSAGFPGVDPGNNGQAGAGGAAGTTGWFTFYFYGCWPQYTSGGPGGSGTSGGRGGIGGWGGAGGPGGVGGSGGLGTPGMVKLHGSVILAGSGTIVCENHTTSVQDRYKGRVTLISNMLSPSLPTFTDDALVGTTTNHPVLRAAAPYAQSLDIPMLGDLQGGTVATSGILIPGFWNQAAYLANHTGSPTIEVVMLQNANSPFDGFDQVFVTNNGATTAQNVTVFFSGGYGSLVIGNLAPGEVWTTTVPTGVTVQAYEQLTASIAETEVKTYVGGSFSLHAAVSGGATPRTTNWRKNGSTISSGTDQYVFTVNPVTVSDAGNYDLEVIDSLSQTVLTAPPVPVSVADPVTITTQPTSTTVVQGSNVVFTVVATGGYAPLTYTWRKNGISLGAPNLPFLSLLNVTPGDAGVYDVIVTDAMGNPPYGYVVSSPATLTVTTPLAISDQPVSVIAYDDEPSASFSITAVGGVPPYSYTWLKNGVPLPPSEQPNAPTLTITAPLTGKDGTYRCVVSDSDTPPTQVQSDPATLSVYPHLQITQQPVGGSYQRFTSATLTVTVTGGVPSYTYVWRKNGTPLPYAQQPQGPTLVLTNLQYADAGNYDVVIYDSHTDAVTSVVAPITVTPPPPLTITQHPQSKTAKVGQSWVFTVGTSGGEGAIHYQWKYDNGGGPVNVGTDQPFLVLNDIQFSDAGQYWVEVSDEVTTLVSDPATLTVVNLPLIQILNHPQNLTLPAGGTAVFNVLVAGGVAPLTYVWKFDDGSGPVSVGTNSPTLTLTNLTRSHTGTYWVEVSDTYETVVSNTATLTVTLAIVDQPDDITVQPGDTIQLSVVADGGAGTFHYQWKFEAAGAKAVVNVGDDSATLTIPSASESDEGQYWVEVSDDFDTVVSNPAYVTVSTGVPAAYGVALVTLATLLAAAGALRMRSKSGRA
jgi:hypothetical protein